MKNIKSHFLFSKQQRNGVFLLLLLILSLQYAYYALEDFSQDEGVGLDSKELDAYKTEIKALRLAEIEARKPKRYPFNPNYISDYKGEILGMSNEAIDRLLKYRKANKWVNSAKEFQRVTQISDSLLAALSPYFKFPEWLQQAKPKFEKPWRSSQSNKTEAEKIDLNIATSEQLQKVYGIGEKRAARIMEYRSRQDGFIGMAELNELYGIDSELIENIKAHFTIKSPKPIKKFILNAASKSELVQIKHIDYEIAHRIIEERTLREAYNSLDDLLKIEGFPVNKIEIIKLYLTLN